MSMGLALQGPQGTPSHGACQWDPLPPGSHGDGMTQSLEGSPQRSTAGCPLPMGAAGLDAASDGRPHLTLGPISKALRTPTAGTADSELVAQL